MSKDPTRVRLPNDHLDLLTSDYLFHLDVPLDDPGTVALFSDVKFVCVGGTSGRMQKLAQHFARVFQQQSSDVAAFDYSFTNERYSGYKVGPVFCVNHGIGNPSVSIVLHEIFKLLQKAQCSGVTLIRIGTCGGIGVPSGTVVISTGALTAGLAPVFSTSSLGEPLTLPAVVDQDLVNDLKNARMDTDGYQVVCGHTYCADDFYQGQGRLDGSFCDYGRAEQRDFLTRLYNKGVRNIEMESAGVLALSHRVGIKAAVVCVVLVDRLECDLPTASTTELREYVDRPIQLITHFIMSKLGLTI